MINKDIKTAIIIITLFIMLVGWMIYVWNFEQHLISEQFNEKKYICDEKCPAALIECKFEDGTKSWGYCVRWHKKP